VTSRIGFSLSGDICLAIQLNECKNVKLSWPAFRINMLMSWAEWLVARHCLIEKFHRFLSLSLNKQKPKFGNLWRKRNGKRILLFVRFWDYLTYRKWRPEVRSPTRELQIAVLA